MLSSKGVAARLKEERERLGLNQQAFGAAGGVSRRTQAAYESGDTSPDLDYMAALAAVGVDVGYVVTGRPAAVATDEEAELLRCYRETSPELRAAALSMLGVAAVGTTSRTGIAISGGTQSQVVEGGLKVKSQTFHVGGGGQKKGEEK